MIRGVLGRESRDGDDGAATVCDDAGELVTDVGEAYLCLCVVTLDLGPVVLEDAETGLELVASLFCTLCASFGIEDGFARGLWELWGLRAVGRAWGRAVGGRLRG